ncbi:hypothetical protein PAECIP112173_02463 [Paenibacillus sp. JJ-100]|uniref:hypothetical protein n=1 Tax=Paenibacillus sp. JJ-100 TaxID=2974896 RepID=UPI0022FF55A5|nr:hypothetical protein [Paenibacillus sp. JJ-100]CAI6077111.1 hypothetical protein PAECIP112173_02463 [Paenibacillus sp. JJ-100]
MVKKQKYLLACAALAMMVALSACSSSAEQPKGESEKANSEAASGTAEPAVTEGESKPATDTEAEVASTSAESEPTASKGETDSVEGLPEFLPTDFPLPDDAKITTETSGEHEGKKSAMLIFTTEQDMETVSKLYKDYFAAKKLTDSGQVIDDKNIIITGAEPDTGNQWSIMGGIKSSEKGVIELTVAWVES